MTVKLSFLSICFFALAACSSSPKSSKDQPFDQDIQSEAPEVDDFSDPELFKTRGEDSEGMTEEAFKDFDSEIESSEEDQAKETFPEPEEAEEIKASNPMNKPTESEESEEPVPKNATRKALSDCNMRSDPSVKSKKVGMVSKGRKVWTEPLTASWYKVYRKNGHAYVSSKCF